MRKELDKLKNKEAIIGGFAPAPPHETVTQESGYLQTGLKTQGRRIPRIPKKGSSGSSHSS